jgi:penicillin-binding protein 1A
MKWLYKIVKYGVGLALFGLGTGATALILTYLYLEPDLPNVEQLRDVRLQVPLRIYSQDQRLIAEFGEKRRIPLKYNEIPDKMIRAFLAAEDDRFFEHPGVDYHGILRAALQLIMTGERRQGGSTITMQVARNFFLSREKTFARKIKEIFLSFRIEQELSKKEIFELYLNKIYLGHRSYGVGAAAQVYYGKPIDQLTLAQTAMIAGLPKAPSTTNPVTNPERAQLRRDYVLGRMASLGFINEQERITAELTPVTATLHTASPEVEAPYLAEMVRAEIIERYGPDAYTNGYQIYTTLDSRHQQAANSALRQALQEYDKRHGYRGPEQHIDLKTTEDLDGYLSDQIRIGDLIPAVVTEVGEQSVKAYTGNGEFIEIEWEGLNWARPYIKENVRGPAPKTAADILKAGDLIRLLQTSTAEEEKWRLAQIPAVSGALVSLDPQSGAIKALVGGYDFYHSKFNRATQAKRQPGSGFKAFIYSAALDAGYTAASMINDAPVVFDDPSLEGAWRPENYSGKFFGPTRLRYALTKSRNLVSIRLLRAIGVQKALDHAALFGFDISELPRNLSLALGSGAVSPLQMAKGYAVLANGGYLIEPYFIERVEEDYQGLIFQASPLIVCTDCDPTKTTSTGDPANPDIATQDEAPAKKIAPRVISQENHYLMNSMMQDVIKYGTGRKARVLGRNDLAGKTGTTNDQRDAWFNGFHPNLVAITWVGFDSFTPLGKGEVGGRAALPAWIAYMREALDGVPEHNLQVPPGIVTIRIDPRTGERASAEQQDAIFEVFRTANAPKQRSSTTATTTGDTGGKLPSSEVKLF